MKGGGWASAPDFPGVLRGQPPQHPSVLRATWTQPPGVHSLTPRCCLRVCTPMPLSRPRWSLHRPGAGPGGGFRDEDAASSAARPPQAGALTTCGAAGSASRKRVPGCGAGGRGPGWSHRDWALQAAAAPTRAPVVSRAPRCCPRLLDGSRDSTQR